MNFRNSKSTVKKKDMSTLDMDNQSKLAALEESFKTWEGSSVFLLM